MSAGADPKILQKYKHKKYSIRRLSHPWIVSRRTQRFANTGEFNQIWQTLWKLKEKHTETMKSFQNKSQIWINKRIGYSQDKKNEEQTYLSGCTARKFFVFLLCNTNNLIKKDFLLQNNLAQENMVSDYSDWTHLVRCSPNLSGLWSGTREPLGLSFGWLRVSSNWTQFVHVVLF